MSRAGGDAVDAGLAGAAAPVLRAAGVPEGPQLEPLPGGGNNRVYRVAAPGGTVVLKVYYRSAADPRDRLRAEFGFASFAWGIGLRTLPHPLACDPAAGMAVYAFVPGTRLAAGGVTAAHVAAAATFFRRVNERRVDPQATGLPEASEACFSRAGHVNLVDRRIDRLAAIDVDSPHGREAAEVVAARIRPAWERVRTGILAGSGAAAPLAVAARCLSPSDFGFHNALEGPDGTLRFLDFEYAGWDDPAKMVCDFFCQPAIPVPRGNLPDFVAAVAAPWGEGEALERRVALLLPAYELKWCCIMLNEFLPAADSRRTFAGAMASAAERRRLQLAKVVATLDRMGA